ncbi:MAG: hypothetical protein ABFS46_14720 [Myxococcota bacterium]
MSVVQGRFWRASLSREEGVVLSLQRESLPADLQEIRDLQITLPLERWNPVVRNVLSDRKLLGGILLDRAQPKEGVATVIARDRLYFDLQRVLLDVTTLLLETGWLVLHVPEPSDP